jgi:undecaprenyl diphosphate synthase
MHVGIIMDGNRTWAKNMGLDFIFGHRAGVKTLEKTMELCPYLGVKTLTIYAFSTENFKRPTEQVEGILGIIADSAIKYKEKLLGKNVRARILGNLQTLSSKIAKPLLELQKATSEIQNESLTLQICVNYGGRDEIIRAVKNLIQKGEEVSEESLSKNLDGSSDPDLIIRTSGQQRLSNFMLWQSAYSEFISTEKTWPEFDEIEFRKILKEYHSRKRRFGK